MRVRNRVLAGAAVTVFAMGALATVGSATPLKKPRKNRQQQATALFVVNASAGTSTAQSGSTFTLDFSGVNPDAVFFTDRPARDTGVLGVDRMLQVLGPGPIGSGTTRRRLGPGSTSGLRCARYAHRVRDPLGR